MRQFDYNTLSIKTARWQGGSCEWMAAVKL
jgi:hypothetical protein